MAITNKIENFHMEVNQPFLDKAEALAPALITTEIRPAGVVEIVPRGQDYAARQVGRGFEQSRPLGRGDSVCLDFGDHWVGYVSFTLAPVGSPQDAPACLRLRFGEIPYELTVGLADYQGEISSSWIQEELIHVDVLPARVRLPRRYAFRDGHVPQIPGGCQRRGVRRRHLR